MGSDERMLTLVKASERLDTLDSFFLVETACRSFGAHTLKSTDNVRLYEQAILTKRILHDGGRRDDVFAQGIS